MALLIFAYILAAFLFFFSYYLDARSGENVLLPALAQASALVALAAAVSAHMMYIGHGSIGSLVFQICLVAFGYVIMLYFKNTISMPYLAKSKFLNVLVILVSLFGAYIVFTTIISLEFNPIYGFYVRSVSFHGLIDGYKLYVYLFMLGIPAFIVLSLVMRALGLKSRIYRQRMLLVALSIITGFLVSFLMFRLSKTYYWALPLVPFGLAVLIVLMFQVSRQSTLLDRSFLTGTLINFLALGVAFSVIAATLSSVLYDLIPYRTIVLIVLALLAFILLSIRGLVSRRFQRFVRIGSNYEAELEAGLESIDYTAGGDHVINSAVNLLDQYVECSSLEILVSDDKGKLRTIYSTIGSKNELSSNNKALDFLLGHNESILLKTQAITSHVYADIKPDLLKLFEIGRSDAFILLREGHRVVGIIMLGPKKRGNDYTDYDLSVLSKLYSNFFLVMYYLKNIANESVVITVDREIEFSGQIITSIQDNIDRINHEKVDVDFITKSARKLGGDFIDFIKLDSDKYLFVMGDVSGKGLNASMSMVILKSVLRTFLAETRDFKKLIVKVNLFIKNNLPKGTFFAGVFGIMDFSTNTMFYINCGVPAMFLYTASYNNAIEIQGEGRILGFVRDIEKYLKVKKIVLNPQDVILMTTDGLVDSQNLRGERFGKDRVQRMLMDNRTYPSARITKFLCESLSEFVSRELEDDITVLVFKYLSK